MTGVPIHSGFRPRRRTSVLAACAAAVAFLACDCRLTAAEPRASRAEPGRNGEAGDVSGRLDQGGENAERPGALDPLFRAINPAEAQRAFDRALGLDAGERSRRPRAPEIPEPVFFDTVRPLGDLKYANELNYLFNSSTRNAPALQVIEYEYTFDDWRAAELDLSYFNGNLEILTPFYQRTLGVSRDGSRVHGVQLSLDDYVRSGFIGASAVYMLGWKPREESRFSTLLFVGANRALINGFNPSLPVANPNDRVFGSWRPLFNADLFYKLSERWTLGVENDLFVRSGRAGEYLSFPFLTWEPGKHLFVQAGGGYYRFESRDQFTVFVHVNFVNPSTRKAREDGEGEPPPAEGRPGRWGRLSRWLGGG